MNAVPPSSAIRPGDVVGTDSHVDRVRIDGDPGAKLGAIALEVGCASASTFSELFRRVIGETPSQWRRRHLEAA